MAKKKPGRPPFKITKEVLNKVEGLAARGLSQEQIAIMIGVDRDTIGKYKKINSDFSAALELGKAKGIAAVTNSLFETAKKGNVAAQSFYLKNRAGWSDKQEMNITGDPLITKIEIEVVE